MIRLKNLFKKSVRMVKVPDPEPPEAKEQESDNREDTRGESEIKNEMNCSCIESDFSNNMLLLEIMRLGYDPANLSREQMIEIMYKHMDNNKPHVLEITTQE